MPHDFAKPHLPSYRVSLLRVQYQILKLVKVFVVESFNNLSRANLLPQSVVLISLAVF